MAFLGVDIFPLVFKELPEPIIIPPCLKLSTNSHVIFEIKEYAFINTSLKVSSSVSTNVVKRIKIKC